MEAVQLTETNGVSKASRANGDSSRAAVTPADIAKLYADDEEFATAFQLEIQHIATERRAAVVRLEARVAMLVPETTASSTEQAPRTRQPRATAAPQAPTKTRGRRKLHPNVEARVAAQPAQKPAKAAKSAGAAVSPELVKGALKAIVAAGSEGIASRALGTKIGTRSGPVVQQLIESKQVRQTGTAGATRYFAA